MTKRTTSSRRGTGRGARLMLRFSRNWLRVVLVALVIFLALPVIAPVLMEIGATGPAQTIYALYTPFCHQFGFRTFYLFGEQAAYPRSIARTDLQPYEQYVANDPVFNASYQFWLNQYRLPLDTPITEFSAALQFAARDFTGNTEMGFKIPLCERDLAMYSAIIVGVLIYFNPVVRRRLRPPGVLLYVILGLGPIGLDGFSQLLGYPPFEWWPPRETTPTFRVLTGFLFGLMNAWLALPYLEVSMRETRQELEARLANHPR